jgi:diaminohydroxyphosphoribosylaminopyrimidine deaminase/5-amino-6-(5-phosphoribosylamino)uracil reductase
MKRGTPWVRLKAAASLDGRTALSNGQSKWITGPKAREDGQFYRACAQGLLTGIGTVLADDPRMNVRLEGLPSPAKFVLDSLARTPVSANILSGEKTTIFVSRRADPARVQSLRKAGAEVAELPEDAEGRLSLAAALDFIARSSVNELFVEAGARLSGRMLAEGLVDELLLYVAPVLLGSGRPIAQLPELIKLSDASRWRFVEAAPVGDDLKVRLRPSAD